MSTVTYDNRTAVVTGGSHGIGRESARRLGADGYNIVVVYSGSKGEAEKAVREVHDAGGSAVHVRADVSEPAAVTSVFDAAEETWAPSTWSSTRPAS